MLLQFCASAQGVVFTATTGAQRIGLEDQLEVSFTIHNVTNLISMGAGPLKDFVIVAGPFQSSSAITSNVNGRATQSVSVSMIYVLQPRRTGILAVTPAIAKDASGNTYQSNPINVSVVKGSVNATHGSVQQMAPQQQRMASRHSANLSGELYLKAVAEKNTVHIGEQVTVKWKLYHRVPLRDAFLKMPSFTGVYSQSLDSAAPEPEAVEVLNGRRYVVHTIKKVAVFPQQTGDLVIAPATLEGYVPVNTDEDNPFNDPFFQQTMGGMANPFGVENVPVAVKSEPLTLHVQPLSTVGQPQNYTGAVGTFSATSSIDRREASTDDIITLTLQIEGRGNFKLFTAPKLVLPKGLVAYDPKASDSITGKGDAITGTKTITYSISPQAAGDYTIPAQSFTFFNPQSGQYETANTGTHTLHIKQGRQGEHGIKGAVLTQIHDIDTKLSGKDGSYASPVILKAGYWIAHASPLLAFIGLLMYRRRKDAAALDTPESRKKRARNLATIQLAKARILLEQDTPRPYYEAVSGAIWQYLSSKLFLPASQLSRSAVTSALIEQGVKGTTLQELSMLMDECESAIYAPGGAQQMTEVYRKAADVITEIESVA